MNFPNWRRSLLLTVVVALGSGGCVADKDSSGDTIQPPADANTDSTGPGEDGRDDGSQLPAGQIAAIQQRAEFVNCDEANATNGFSPFKMEVQLSQVVVTAARFDLYEHPSDPSRSLDGYFISDPEGGPWSGVLLSVRRGNNVSLQIGDLVDITGEAQDYWCNTQITGNAVTIKGTAPLPSPSVVTAAELASAEQGETWEGVLVQVRDARVTKLPNQFGEWTLDDALRVDDVYAYDYSPSLGDRLDVTGVMHYTFSTRKLLPRGDADIETSSGPDPDAVDSDAETDTGGDSWIPPDGEEEGWTISAIQDSPPSLGCDTPNGSKTIVQDLELRGVLVASEAFYISASLDGYFLTDGQGGPFSGVQLVVPKNLGVQLEPGQAVDVVGNWVEFYCLTQISAKSIQIIAADLPLPNPSVATSIALGQPGPTAESFEGVLVQVENATVTDADKGFGQFEVDGALLVDDGFPLSYSPKLGDELSTLRGFLTYSFNAFKVLPRNDDDIVLAGTGPDPDAGNTDVGEPDVVDAGAPDVTGTDTTAPDWTISTIQQHPSSANCTVEASNVVIQAVTLDPVVVASPKFSVSANLDGYYLSDGTAGPYSGMMATVPKSMATNYAVGDLLSVQGQWVEHFCMTQIAISAAAVQGGGIGLPPAPLVTAADLAGPNAESWEGVIVRIADSTVSATKNANGVWQVTDLTGTAFVGSDFALPFTPAVGQDIANLRGAVRYSFSQYRIHPTQDMDIEALDPPPTSATTISAIQQGAASLTCPGNSSVVIGPASLDQVVVVSPKGYVSANLSGYHVMTPPNAPYAGIFIVVANAINSPEIQLGDTINLSGEYREHFCLSQINVQSFSITGTASATLTAISVTVAEIAQGREDLEGSLVVVSGVTAAAAPDQFGEFPIGQGVLVDNTYHSHAATTGKAYTSITGFLHYAFDAWRISPRNASDIVAAP